MGIDYYNCSICEEIFPDVISYGHCSNCDEILCESCMGEQVKKYGNPEERSDAAAMYGSHSPIKCDLCSGEIIQDYDIIQWFVDETGITKDEVVKLIKENIRGNN